MNEAPKPAPLASPVLPEVIKVPADGCSNCSGCGHRIHAGNPCWLTYRDVWRRERRWRVYCAYWCFELNEQDA